MGRPVSGDRSSRRERDRDIWRQRKREMAGGQGPFKRDYEQVMLFVATAEDQYRCLNNSTKIMMEDTISRMNTLFFVFFF